MKTKNFPGAAISVDHIGAVPITLLLQSTYSVHEQPNLFAQITGGFPSLWARAAGASSFMWTTLDALPQILQVRVMQCAQWALTGKNINLHLEDETKSCQSHNVAQKCAVCVLAAHLHLK